MKSLLIAALTLVSVSAMATTIRCTGEGKTLETSFSESQVGAFEAEAFFGENGQLSKLPSPMKIEVTVAPAGTFYKDLETRSYIGSFVSSDLKIGFSKAIVLSLGGDQATAPHKLNNVFGMNSQTIGTCLVLK